MSRLLLPMGCIVLAAACGGSSTADRTAQLTPTPVVSPSASASATLSARPSAASSSTPASDTKLLYPFSFRTGIPALDPVVVAAAAADGSKLVSLVELRSVLCTHRTGGDVTSPPCETDEAEGKTVQVFNGSGCQPNLQRGPGASSLIRSVAETPHALYGAYRPKGSDVTQILMGTGTPSGWVTFEVSQSGKLVGLSTNCGGQFRFDGPPSSDVVVSPPP